MKTFKLLCFLLLAVVTITACSKDDTSSPDNKGQFTYTATTYETNYATFVVTRDTAQLGFTKALNTTGAVTGTGFSFVLGTDKVLPVGTFTFKYLKDPTFDKTKNFFIAGTTIGYDWQLQTGIRNALLINGSGTLVIKKTDDTHYEISYNVTFTDTKTMSGTYTGTVSTVIQPG
jgi:hypothetical protein